MKILKRLFYLVIIFILLITVSVFLITRFVNPNYYKEKIITMVHEKTGRELSIQGEIELSFFPWIGARVHDVQLSNAPGFQPSYFASVGEADVSVKLLPLLSKQVEVGKVTLRDLTLNLAKNKDGVTNWQDLTAAKKETTDNTSSSTDTKPTAKNLVFSVAGVNIENANVSWMDAQKGQNIVLKNVQAKSDNPARGHSFPFSLAFDIQSVKPNIVGHFSFKSDILANIDNATYELKNLRADFSAQKNAALSFKADMVSVDSKAQTLSVSDAVISDGDLSATLQLQGKQISDNPIFTGQLKAAPFNLKNVLKTLGKPLTTTDPNALQKVSFNTQFSATPSSVSFKPLTLHLDDSTMQGNFAVTNFATSTLRFDLSVDSLNVDNYLPPSTSTNAASTPATATTASGNAPSNTMRQSDIAGNLRINKLTAGKIVLNQMSAQIALKNGVLNLDPFSAGVYKGNMHGKVAIDFRNNPPKYVIDETLTDIDMTELVKSGRLTGKANITTHITLQGESKPAMMRSLNGNIQFNVKNGALVGANIPYQVERALAVFKRQTPPPEPAEKETRFDALQGTGTFTNGLFSNNDLVIQSDQFKGNGSGTANLVTQVLDYRLQFVGLHTVTDAQGNATQEQRRTPIAVLITGTFDKPIITPDIRALLQNEVQQRVQQRLQERLGPGAGRLLERLLRN